MNKVEPATGNEWLRRKADRDGVLFAFERGDVAGMTLQELKKAMYVTLWVDDARGRHQLSTGALPLEEVINIHFAGEAVVGGFSVWLGEREVFRQRLGFPSGFVIPREGGSLEIDMSNVEMELIPPLLS